MRPLALDLLAAAGETAGCYAHPWPSPDGLTPDGLTRCARLTR